MPWSPREGRERRNDLHPLTFGFPPSYQRGIKGMKKTGSITAARKKSLIGGVKLGLRDLNYHYAGFLPMDSFLTLAAGNLRSHAV
jgi:hypothetical protein